MKINCLHCGHAFGVDNSYCDYEGLLKCPTCGGLLEARIQDGMIRSVRPGSMHAAPAPQPAPQPAPEPAPQPAFQTPAQPFAASEPQADEQPSSEAA